MDDTQLKQLKEAARAAGYTPTRATDDGTALLLEGVQQPWNPRDENPHSDCMGDALRLAVKLGVVIDVRYTNPEIAEHNSVNYWLPGEEHNGWSSIEFGEHSDPCAATCRAIVRAAAEIGRTSATGKKS